MLSNPNYSNFISTPTQLQNSNSRDKEVLKNPIVELNWASIKHQTNMMTSIYWYTTFITTILTSNYPIFFKLITRQNYLDTKIKYNRITQEFKS